MGRVFVKREASLRRSNLGLRNRLVCKSQKVVIRRAISALQVGSPNKVSVVSFSTPGTDRHIKFLQYRAHHESEYGKGGGGISS